MVGIGLGSAQDGMRLITSVSHCFQANGTRQGCGFTVIQASVRVAIPMSYEFGWSVSDRVHSHGFDEPTTLGYELPKGYMGICIRPIRVRVGVEGIGT